MKKIFLLACTIVFLVSCTKTPITGDLLLSTEWQTIGEENVEVWLYESLEKFDAYEYYDKQFSDEAGEVFFGELEPGWYYIEAEKVKSSQFTLYKMDSVEVLPDRQVNKIIVLEPAQ